PYIVRSSLAFFSRHLSLSSIFFFNDPATTAIYTLSLHDALPISLSGNISRYHRQADRKSRATVFSFAVYFNRSLMQVHQVTNNRSEEHTSELQSPYDLVCRLLLEKKKKQKPSNYTIPCPN